ncbi:hypothetical protein MP638_007156 [Amoeboaphelidium occidentale]|nr:hypothetical protein MP638_007156 [Amoeboaphelidium occidentale]
MTESDSEEFKERTTYCVCKMPCEEYDPVEFMIQCDHCENWFHGRCIQLNEEQSESIEQYICKECETDTRKSSFKTKCLTCAKALKRDFSKYCSDACGVANGRVLLSAILNKKLEGVHIADPIPEEVSADVHGDSALVSKEQSLQSKREMLLQRKRNIHSSVQLAVTIRSALTSPSLCCFNYNLTNLNAPGEEQRFEFDHETLKQEAVSIDSAKATYPFLCWEEDCSKHVSKFKIPPALIPSLSGEDTLDGEDVPEWANLLCNSLKYEIEIIDRKLKKIRTRLSKINEIVEYKQKYSTQFTLDHGVISFYGEKSILDGVNNDENGENDSNLMATPR